jgi:hypothetical protein
LRRLILKGGVDMFKLFDKGFIADIFLDFFEPASIHKAVEDLQSDISKVSGKLPIIKKYIPSGETGYVVIGSIRNENFNNFLRNFNIDMSAIKGRWENYVIMTFGLKDENLLICGSDDRGTMWGIYEFCEKYLGVDPLYFWTDNEPEEMEKLIIDKLNVLDGPKTYKFRGWFINDEDIFTEWKSGGGTRYIDYPFYHQVTHQSIIEKVIETALRLKQNLMIPASFVDIQNPAEENLVRMVTERGMFISQHHVEPMGVSHFAWDNYWRKRGLDISASFVKYPDKYEEIWSDYASKWARYGNVIWQFGLRGRGDRPVWYHDDSVSPSMEERGKLISSAIEKQKKVVEKVLGHNNFYSTTTLWMEGSELHNDGYLAFPEGTMVIFADHGPSQMLSEDFYNVKRHNSNEYGVYYHVAFWGDGPHLVQGTSLDKIYFNYKNAVEKGDTVYSILNVTNLREMVFGVKAVADITWDFNSFDKQRYLRDWCSRQFGSVNAEAASKVYQNIYASYYKLDSKRIPDHLVLLDGMVRYAGLRLIEAMKEINNNPDIILNNKTYFRSNEEAIAFYEKATSEALPMWKNAYDSAFYTLEQVGRRKQYFIDNIIVQIEIAVGLYSWLYYLSLAAKARLINKDEERTKENIHEAIYCMEKLLIDRKKAEHDKWHGWYNGDKKMNLPQVLISTKELLNNAK